MRSDRLLLNILPEPIADGFTEASIFFCDIVDFTVMSSGKPTEEVVDILIQWKIMRIKLSVLRKQYRISWTNSTEKKGCQCSFGMESIPVRWLLVVLIYRMDKTETTDEEE